MELLTRNNFEGWMQKLMERLDRQDELLLAMKAEGKQPTCFGCRFLDVLQDYARLNRDAVVCKVDFVDAVDFGEIEQYATGGYRRAAQTGIAALRGNGDTVFKTKPHDFLYIFYGMRLQDDVRFGNKAAALVV